VGSGFYRLYRHFEPLVSNSVICLPRCDVIGLYLFDVITAMTVKISLFVIIFENLSLDPFIV
jgi:hypothetical protein